MASSAVLIVANPPPLPPPPPARPAPPPPPPMSLPLSAPPRSSGDRPCACTGILANDDGLRGQSIRILGPGWRSRRRQCIPPLPPPRLTTCVDNEPGASAIASSSSPPQQDSAFSSFSFYQFPQYALLCPYISLLPGHSCLPRLIRENPLAKIRRFLAHAMIKFVFWQFSFGRARRAQVLCTLSDRFLQNWHWLLRQEVLAAQ